MRIFHRHTWVVHSAHFTPPPYHAKIGIIQGSEGAIHSVYRRLTLGVTNIYLYCKTCGTIESREVFGCFQPNATPPADQELAELRKLAGID